MTSPIPPMTLRQFVRSTFDNFRQLIHSFSAVSTAQPMPVFSPSAHDEAGSAPPLGGKDRTFSAALDTEGHLQLPIGSNALPLAGALESLLFVADGPVEATQLARLFDVEVAIIEEALQTLAEHFREQARGLRLQVRNGRYQLVTAPEAAAIIETFLNLNTATKLSAPALETLALVAYRQPATRAQIEAVRGVDCSGVLRSLLPARAD